MKQAILKRFKEEFNTEYKEKINGGYLDNVRIEDVLSFLESELTLFEKEVREKTLEKVMNILSDTILPLDGSDDTYENLWLMEVEDKIRLSLKELNTPQEKKNDHDCSKNKSCFPCHVTPQEGGME